MERKIAFKRNESFYIRDGWFGKAITAIAEAPEGRKNIFYKNDGILRLGIGANMVKGLKYWLSAANVIAGKENDLSEFGGLLRYYDPFLDSLFSWYLIHYFLVSNDTDAPIFHTVFNLDVRTFSKSALLEILKEHYPNTKVKYLEDDLNVFLHSYITDEVILNPEDNYACPLAQLKLLTHEKGIYKRKANSYKRLSYLVVYYVLQEIYKGKKSFVIEDSIKELNSPYRIFNLDKYTYLQYLEEMSKNDLVVINRTAGLNPVYFNRLLSLKECFEENFGHEIC